jgi:hypothetical protein|tara:strand:+ start:6271 stop:6708 length:438 start_codon:yes stop_codon:yes gene_type:complete
MSLSEKIEALKNVVDTNEEKKQQRIINKREKIITNLFNRLAEGDDDFAANLVAKGSAIVTIVNYDLKGGFNLFAHMLGNKLSSKAVCTGINMDAIRTNRAYNDFKAELSQAGYNIVDENIHHEQEAPNIVRVKYVVGVAAANEPA